MMMSVLLLGFLIGVRHAFEADHIAAVASLSTRAQSLKDAVRMGMTWGFGHTLTLFIFGSIVLFSDLMIPERLALILEFVVGVMLVGLGVDVVRRMLHERVHFHNHAHDGVTHFHAHSHANEGKHEDSAHQHGHKNTISMRALMVGLMHGMAGSAALIVLTLQSVESPMMGLLYIALFGFGSVAGMAVLAGVVMLPLRHSAKQLTGLYSGLQTTIGLGTITLGLYVMFDIGVIEGLII